jgi:hypothetical protein
MIVVATGKILSLTVRQAFDPEYAKCFSLDRWQLTSAYDTIFPQMKL